MLKIARVLLSGKPSTLDANEATNYIDRYYYHYAPLLTYTRARSLTQGDPQLQEAVIEVQCDKMLASMSRVRGSVWREEVNCDLEVIG